MLPKAFYHDEDGLWIDWPVLFLYFIGTLVVLGGTFSFLADQGLLDRWLVEKTGTDYVGLVREYDGQSWQCIEVSYEGYCTEWDALQDTAVDVAEHFGENVFGIAKGEAPLIPASEWYAPFVNPINQTVWSLSISLNLSIFAILMIAVLISGTVIVVLVKPQSASVVLALYSLPGYVAFLSMSSLAGPGWVMALHCISIPAILLMFLLKLLGGIHVSTFSHQSADGERSSGFHMGPSVGGGLKKGNK